MDHHTPQPHLPTLPPQLRSSPGENLTHSLGESLATRSASGQGAAPQIAERRAFVTRLASALLAPLTLLGQGSGGARCAFAQQVDPFVGIESVEVFCNCAMVIQTVSHPPFSQVIYRMDAMEQLVRQINARLPQEGEKAALEWTREHDKTLRRTLAPAAAAAANAANRANYYHINRIPAIVVNARSCIYGLTDVGAALDIFRAHVLGQKEGS